MSFLDGYRVSHAQNREDLIISAFFPDVETGFYIDAGAGHPELLSVSKHFYDRGWSGINIEPIESLADLLEHERPRDITLPVALGDHRGTQLFREYPDGIGLSTLSAEMMDAYEQSDDTVTASFVDRHVQVLTLAEILDLHAAAVIHFLKIDVEGGEYALLSGNDWERFRPQLLCIEANHVVQDWRPLLAAARYRQVYFDGLNEYYLSIEAMWRRESFDYVDTLISRPVIDGPSARRISTLESLVGDIGVDPDADAIAELALIKSSRSWKLTAPLRNATRVRGSIRSLRDWTTGHVVGPLGRSAARYPILRRTARRHLGPNSRTRARLRMLFDDGASSAEPLRKPEATSQRAADIAARLAVMRVGH